MSRLAYFRSVTRELVRSRSVPYIQPQYCCLHTHFLMKKTCFSQRSKISEYCSPYSKFGVDERFFVSSSSKCFLNISKTECEEFDDLFSEVINSAISIPDADMKEAVEWFQKVLEYNVPHGKKTRGMSVVQSFKLLVNPHVPSSEDIKLARILGWCVELLQAFFLIYDDVMDQSTTRRGKLCWYKNKEVGLMACNDSILIEASVYAILKQYFRNKSYYINLMEAFHEITFYTSLGQCVDIMYSKSSRGIDLQKFGPEQYSTIVKYKTALYSFYLPVALAMYMAGITDQKLHNQAKAILLEIGHLFQVQDDYLDCFGNPQITGKIGTDIEEGKCSWLVLMAMKKGDSSQRNIIKDNYGRSDPVSISTIKDLYESLKLREFYRNYEEETYTKIKSEIENMNSQLPSLIFTELLHKIYQRNK